MFLFSAYYFVEYFEYVAYVKCLSKKKEDEKYGEMLFHIFFNI